MDKPHTIVAKVEAPARSRVARGSAPAGAASRSILRGELENISLPTLLTMLDMERRSGMLLVARQRQLGRLYVRAGRVIRARIEGARKTSSLESLHQMLRWEAGQFELWQAEVDGRDEVGETTTFLLMESARRQDEARGISHGADTVGNALGEAW